jgi:hypothetical protein
MMWIPHGDAYCHALGRQAVYQSPTEEPPSAEYDDRAHYLLRQAGFPTDSALVGAWAGCLARTS